MNNCVMMGHRLLSGGGSELELDGYVDILVFMFSILFLGLVGWFYVLLFFPLSLLSLSLSLSRVTYCRPA